MSRSIGIYTFINKNIDNNEAIEDYSYILDTDTEQLVFEASDYADFAVFNLEFYNDLEKADRYFLKSLEIEPDNPFWLGSYAMFLHYYKKDIKKAALYYSKSIELDNDIVHIYNYALLALTEQKKYKLAESMLKLSISLEPDDLKIRITYIGYLLKIKKDYVNAEKELNKILKFRKKEKRIWALYAQLKIFDGQKEEADKIISQAFNSNLPDEILMELWFYRYAHLPKWLEKAEFELNKMINNGIKTFAWGLTQNVIIAIFEGHPYANKLQELATKIKGNYKY